MHSFSILIFRLWTFSELKVLFPELRAFFLDEFFYWHLKFSSRKNIDNQTRRFHHLPIGNFIINEI